MELLDNNLIARLVLQNSQPVYVVDEATKKLVFTNEELDRLVGCCLVGENCYKAFFGDERITEIGPPARAPGESLLWDYVDGKTGRFFKIKDYWFESEDRLYRMGILTDVSDFMDINRTMEDYLWLMQELSELQMKLAREQRNALPPLLDFFRLHYKCKRAAISFYEHGADRTFASDRDGIHDLPYAISSTAQPYEFVVNGHKFSLFLEEMEREATWEEDKSFVMSVARLYIENSMLWQRMEWENQHDRLTGLLSRASLEDFINDRFSDCEQLGIIYMDIDDLKRTNDTLGHAAGDCLIKKAAGVLLELSDKDNFVFRMGGDEFMLVSTDCTARSLEAMVNRLQSAVKEKNTGEEAPLLTLSCGRAFSERPFIFSSLMRAADKQMYDIKHGRKQSPAHIERS